MENLAVPQEKVWKEPKKGEELTQCRCRWVCAPCAFPCLRAPVPARLGDRIGLKCPNSAVSSAQLETPKVDVLWVNVQETQSLFSSDQLGNSDQGRAVLLSLGWPWYFIQTGFESK